MTQKPSGQKKLSDTLTSRLEQLSPDQFIRLVVLLSLPNVPEQPSGRASRRANRAATIEAARTAARAGIPDVDQILERYGGRMLSTDVNPLGAIAVETTAEGARSLARSEHVRMLLEDQATYGVFASGG